MLAAEMIAKQQSRVHTSVAQGGRELLVVCLLTDQSIGTSIPKTDFTSTAATHIACSNADSLCPA